MTPRSEGNDALVRAPRALRVLFAVFFGVFALTVAAGFTGGGDQSTKVGIAVVAILAGVYGLMLGLNFHGTADWAVERFIARRSPVPGYPINPQTVGWLLAGMSVLVALVVLFGTAHTTSS